MITTEYEGWEDLPHFEPMRKPRKRIGREVYEEPDRDPSTALEALSLTGTRLEQRIIKTFMALNPRRKLLQSLTRRIPTEVLKELKQTTSQTPEMQIALKTMYERLCRAYLVASTPDHYRYIPNFDIKTLGEGIRAATHSYGYFDGARVSLQTGVPTIDELHQYQLDLLAPRHVEDGCKSVDLAQGLSIPVTDKIRYGSLPGEHGNIWTFAPDLKLVVYQPKDVFDPTVHIHNAQFRPLGFDMNFLRETTQAVLKDVQL